MLDVVNGVILNVLALAAIGIGPALSLLSTEKRFETAIGIAPVLGFALTSVFGTYLVCLDKPVSEWASLWLVTSIALSLVLCLIVIWKRKLGFDQVDWHVVTVFVIGLGVTTAFVTLPIIVGGLNFTTLRGNGTDTFNYVTLAGYLDHEPYSWAWQADTQSLIDRHPSYYLARQLLPTRWTTHAILAWTSRIAQIPIYRFEYGYSVLSFVLAFGPALWFALLTKIRMVQGLLLAGAICVGFWAQFVLDIRAMSQMYSVPMVLLLALLVARIEDNKTDSTAGEYVLLAITLAALIFTYVEILPTIVLSLAILIVTGLRAKPLLTGRTLGYLFSLAAAIAATLPLVPSLSGYLTHQIRYAAGGHNDWHKAYFSWLYSNPITGLWGLSNLSTDKQIGLLIAPGLLKTIMLLLGLLLSFMLIYLLVRIFPKRRCPSAIAVTASFAIAALMQFSFLVLRGQLWAAGKSVSFAFPFIMTGAVAPLAMASQSSQSRWNVSVAKIATFGVSVWIVVQCMLGLHRIILSSTGLDYPNYIRGHSEYRRHDWNIASFSDILQKEKGVTVWLSVSNCWVAEYLVLALGWNASVVNVEGITDRSGTVIGQQTLSKFPEYVIVDTKSWGSTGDKTSYIVAQNSELSLIKIRE